MIDVASEETFGLIEASKIFPRGRRGKRPHLSTLLRWITDGCRAPGGRRVRLEALRLGSKWVTSRQAIQRFAERLTPSGDAPPSPRSATTRSRASARAAAELDRAGI